MNKISIKKILKKILVIKPSSLGDIVHSLPFLNAVKDAFPSAEIHWVVAKGLEGLLENHPMVKRLWIINKDHWKNLKKIKETAIEIKFLFKELKAESYDVVIDLQGLLRSGIFTYATRSPVRVGFKEAREGSSLFYTHRVEGGKEIHAVDKYLKIASAMGCDINDVKFPMPLIVESENVKKLKDNIEDYAIIAPGARWETKKWPSDRFGKVASMLDIKTIVIGSSSDAEIAKEIEFSSEGKALSMAGKTDIKDLISIIRSAKFIVTNDSGPMHIAAALNIPTIALFGPTNSVKTGPYTNRKVIVSSDIKCAPCYKRKCKSIKCMYDVSVEAVYNAIMGRLYEISNW